MSTDRRSRCEWLSELHLIEFPLDRSLFKRCPETRALFGFDSTDPDDVQLAASPKFRANAINLTTMLDTAVDMLGPDQDTLTEILKRLGERVRGAGHVAGGSLRCINSRTFDLTDRPFLSSHSPPQHRDSYGVKPRMYSHMRESLISALISLLGDEYMTKDLKDAWHEAFHLFAADMAPDESEDDWHTEVFKAH